MKSAVVSHMLLLVMAAYLIIPVIPVIDYLVNKDYIAKNLCINKDKPKSCCKGKCHMVKQLLKTNQNPENDTKNTNKRTQLKELNEFVLSNTNDITIEKISIEYLDNYTSDYCQLASYTIFVPPKLPFRTI